MTDRINNIQHRDTEGTELHREKCLNHDFHDFRISRMIMPPLFSQAPLVATSYNLRPTLIPLLTDNAHNKGIRAGVFGVALATKGAFGNKGFPNHVNQENQENHVQTNAGTGKNIQHRGAEDTELHRDSQLSTL